MAAAGAPAAAMPHYAVSPSLETAYLALVIGSGQILVPVLLALSCIRGFSRHPALLQFLASWLLYSLATSLLLYSGHAFEPHPSESICIAQVSLQQAALLIVSFSAIALMLQLWFTLPTVSTSKPHSTTRDVLLVGMPYTVAGIYIACFYIVCRYAPSYVPTERGRFTCRIAEGPNSAFFSKFVPAVIGVALIVCLVMSIWMLKKTVKRLVGTHWSLKEGLHSSGGRSWLPILMRFALFGSYAVLCISAALIIVFTPQGPLHDIVDWYTATLPLVAFLIFAPWPRCSGESSERSERTQTATATHLPIQQMSIQTLVGVDSLDDKQWHSHQNQRESGASYA